MVGSPFAPSELADGYLSSGPANTSVRKHGGPFPGTLIKVGHPELRVRPRPSVHDIPRSRVNSCSHHKLLNLKGKAQFITHHAYRPGLPHDQGFFCGPGPGPSCCLGLVAGSCHCFQLQPAEENGRVLVATQTQA